MALRSTPSSLASLRPFVNSSCETSCTWVPSISQYTNTLFIFLLANNLLVQQFLYQSLYVGIAASESLALLGLEYDVLNSFHLCGRTAQTTLLWVAVNIGHRPLVESEVGTLVIQFLVGHVFSALQRSCSTLVFHHELHVARTAGSCASVDSYNDRHGCL